ncbi:MAG: hypothetical protein JWQ38_2763 [Flavipsychrobacter sp.]|nr:hypothetical protein [Flavipsychrobacter sp.]
MKIFPLCVLLFVLFTGSITAQPVTGINNDDNDDPYENMHYFMFGANYLSDNVYVGRKDSARSPYYSPYMGYHLKNGLYAKVTASYSGNKRRVDLLTLEAGYEHTFGEHLNTGATIDKFFYNKNTNTIRGNTRASTGIYGQYSNNWVQPMVCFDVNLDKKKADYVVGIVLDHDFKLLDKTLHIIPAATLNAGTQHFYDDYLLGKLLKSDKTLKLTQALATANRFKALDYELSTKITYRTGKWLFTAIPTYAIPLNPNTIVFPKITYQEKLVNSFYIELDICHR